LNPISRGTVWTADDGGISKTELTSLLCQTSPIGQREDSYLVDWSNSVKAALNKHVVDETVHAAADAADLVTTVDATDIATAGGLVDRLIVAFNLHRVKENSVHSADTDENEAKDRNGSGGADALFVALEWLDRAFMRHRVTAVHAVSLDWWNCVDMLGLNGLRNSADTDTPSGYITRDYDADDRWDLPTYDRLELSSLGLEIDTTGNQIVVYNTQEALMHARISVTSGGSGFRIGSMVPVQSLVGTDNPVRGPGQ